MPGSEAPASLARVRTLVEPALRRAVAVLSDEIRPAVEYHLGWVDKFGKELVNDGGKGIRQALAVLSAEVVGAPAVIGVPGAVAVELVHNFSLIHDDVIDGDTERRHRATVWTLFGVGAAIVAGDALLTLGQQVLLNPAIALGTGADVDLVAASRAARLLADSTADMNAGQALDLKFEHERSVSYGECLMMEAGKTGALLSCAAAIGAVFAGAEQASVDALATFGAQLGLAFQAVDDLLGIWGDPATTGKPTFADLRQHKKTLPVTAAIAAGGPGADELMELLAEAELSESQVTRAAELVDALGGRQQATDQARTSMEIALEALQSAATDPSATDELIELAHFIVDRQF
jgi:geranylgeranyl diphosphate synthase, type I